MSVLSATSQQLLEDTLVKNGMLTAAKLLEARDVAAKESQPLLSYLVKHNYITDEQLTKANASITKVPYVNLSSAKVDPAVLALLPRDIAKRYMAVPVSYTHLTLPTILRV